MHISLARWKTVWATRSSKNFGCGLTRGKNMALHIHVSSIEAGCAGLRNIVPFGELFHTLCSMLRRSFTQELRFITFAVWSSFLFLLPIRHSSLCSWWPRHHAEKIFVEETHSEVYGAHNFAGNTFSVGRDQVGCWSHNGVQVDWMNFEIFAF